MPDYSLGKVYKITGNGLIYVGSTTQRLLCQRFSQHNASYKKYLKGKWHFQTSYKCLSDPNCKIELLEACSCSCYDELIKCESKYIRELDCVNKVIPDRTKSEYLKEYYELNREKIAEQHKEYRLENREKKKEYQRLRYQKLKEQKSKTEQ